MDMTISYGHITSFSTCTFTTIVCCAFAAPAEPTVLEFDTEPEVLQQVTQVVEGTVGCNINTRGISIKIANFLYHFILFS